MTTRKMDNQADLVQSLSHPIIYYYIAADVVFALIHFTSFPQVVEMRLRFLVRCDNMRKRWQNPLRLANFSRNEDKRHNLYPAGAGGL